MKTLLSCSLVLAFAMLLPSSLCAGTGPPAPSFIGDIRETPSASDPLQSDASDTKPVLLKNLFRFHQIKPLQELLTLLDDSDSRVRWLAASELGESGYFEAVPQLMKHLGDRNMEVRRRSQAALLALGRKQPKTFAGMMAAGLAGLPTLEKTIAQALALELEGDSSGADTLYENVFSTTPLFAEIMLRVSGDGKIARQIMDPLEQQADTVYRDVIQTMKNPGKTYPQSHLRQAYALNVAAEMASWRILRHIDALNAAGRSRDAEAFRSRLGSLIATVKKLGAAAKNLELLLVEQIPSFRFSDEDDLVIARSKFAAERARAAQALGSHQAGDVQQALTKALISDPSPLVRAAAAESVGRICQTGAVEALTNAFENDDRIEVRRTALYALSCNDTSDVRELIYQSVKNPEFKEAAILAIGRLGKETDIDFLLKASEDKRFYRPSGETLENAGAGEILRTIAEALEFAAEASTPSKRETVRHQAENIRQRAASAETDFHGGEDGVPVTGDITIKSPVIGPPPKDIKGP